MASAKEVPRIGDRDATITNLNKIFSRVPGIRWRAWTVRSAHWHGFTPGAPD